MKKLLIIFMLILIATMNTSYANTIINEIQSPIYTDDLGRSHFLGKGGYSSTRHIDMGNAYSEAINEVTNQTVKKNVDTDITSVIKEKNEIPVSSKAKATFSSQNRTMDASASFGQGATYLPDSGVNNSKTIYTDDLGRLHFFGKGNLIRE
ncbi:hypothetical protein J6R97_06185 [bacterium]|nr:hypothetical protein [bacterium]